MLRGHTHPMARPEAAPAPAATGIDYLSLIEARHAAELATRIDYAQLALPDELVPKPAAEASDGGTP